MIKNRSNKLVDVLIILFFIVLCVLILYPFLCILSISLSTKEDISKFGFSIIPHVVDFSAYELLFLKPEQLLSAYGTTFFVSIAGCFLAVTTSAMYAYAISRTYFKWRKVLTGILMFTMFFSGGMAASYIVNTTVLNLKNTLTILIVPGTFGAMNVIICRSYFNTLPYGLAEAAKIDGANEYQIFFRIMLPLAKPAIATIALMTFVNKWNSYYESMMYMDYGEKVTIQLLLQRMMAQVDFLKDSMGMLTQAQLDLPSEALRMAMCALTVFPMVIIFPFFQKYFVKGMAIGSVKE